jgi:hypothetical protein
MNPTPPPVAEPGYKTTEFWGKLVIQVISLAVLIAAGTGHPLAIDPSDPATSALLTAAGALLAIVVPEIVYMISRSIRKAGTTAGPTTITTTTSPSTATTPATSTTIATPLKPPTPGP